MPAVSAVGAVGSWLAVARHLIPVHLFCDVCVKGFPAVFCGGLLHHMWRECAHFSNRLSVWKLRNASGKSDERCSKSKECEVCEILIDFLYLRN